MNCVDVNSVNFFLYASYVELNYLWSNQCNQVVWTSSKRIPARALIKIQFILVISK